MYNLVSQEIINNNLKILENLKVGDKLYVDHQTLELSVDNRIIQGFRRYENRHECLLPILISLISRDNKKDLLCNLKETYKNKFQQLEYMEKLMNLINELKIQVSKNKNYEKLIEEKNNIITNLKKKLEETHNSKKKIRQLESQIKSQKNTIEKLYSCTYEDCNASLSKHII